MARCGPDYDWINHWHLHDVLFMADRMNIIVGDHHKNENDKKTITIQGEV